MIGGNGRKRAARRDRRTVIMAGIVPGLLGRIFGVPLKDSDVSELSASLSNGVDTAVVAQVAELLRRFSVLVEVIKTIAKSVSLDGMLPHSIEVIVEVLHADRAILFLHDGQAREDGVWVLAKR